MANSRQKTSIRLYAGTWLKYFSVLTAFLLMLYFLFAYKVVVAVNTNNYNIFVIYVLLVSVDLLIKQIASLFHRKYRYSKPKYKHWPSIAVIIPAYNEGPAVYETLRSIDKADYTRSKVEVIVINDGSTDDTRQWIRVAVKEARNFKIKFVDLRKNRGKRGAMAEGIRRTSSKYLIFIDSDSRVFKETLKELIKPYFSKQTIGAVSGHVHVWNATRNAVTAMQSVRYFRDFKAAKATESLIGFVTCCPGCGSSYDRAVVAPVMKTWVNQKFLGIPYKLGDDRSLTNLVLRSGYKTVYNEAAKVMTMVPDTLRKWTRQQLRWKRSWFIETTMVLSFVWRRSPLATLAVLTHFSISILAPIVLARILFLAATQHLNLIYYGIGALMLSIAFGSYYSLYNIDAKRWLRGSLLNSIISFASFWQLPYALVTLRKMAWGTR